MNALARPTSLLCTRPSAQSVEAHAVSQSGTSGVADWLPRRAYTFALGYASSS